MLLKPNRRAGRHRPARPAGRELWTARGLLVAAAVLLIWAATSIVTEQPTDQVSSAQRASTPAPVAGEVENRRFVAASRRPAPPIQPPLGQPQRPARAAAANVQRPAASVDPQSIKIPALDIDQDLIELAVVGTDLQVPDDYSDVGWWRGGPAPGDPGASVMVGHVDSPTGPAVFYQLSGLRSGDEITVGFDNGSRTVFTVRKVQAYERSGFPSARVYRSHGKPTLHLLTCGGSFDSEAGQYSSNVVVYADLVQRVPGPADKPGWYKRLTEASKRKVADANREAPARPSGRPEWYQRLVEDSRAKIRANEQGKPQ